MGNNLIIFLIATACALRLHSNYNYSQVNEKALLSEPILLSQRHSQTVQRPPLIQQFPLRKYELKDTGYHVDDSSLSQIDHQLIYQMEPPSGVFAQDVISLQNYHLLEIRQFQVGIANPSAKFTICIKEIVIDSEEVKRNDEKGALPHCLLSGISHPFNFSLYVGSPYPSLVRITIYFLVQILDGKDLVEQKSYAQKIQAFVIQNHLRMQTIYYKNYPASQTLRLHNYQSHEVAILLESKKRLQTIHGESLQRELVIMAGRTVQIQLEGKQNQIIIHTRSNSKKFPTLLLKTNCEEQLIVDYHNIGILTDQRMVVDVPLTVTSKASSNLTLIQISLESTSSAVELEQRPNAPTVLSPLARSVPIAMMRIHSSKQPERRSTITIRVKYQQLGQEKTAVQRFVYVEIRNAVSAGQRKYIDVTKYATGRAESRFPIKNNLNVPIFLNKITVDQSIFQLTWQSQRRRLIYPNHSSEQFSLVYTGSLNLPLSSLKYLALLEFNGHILVPFQITIYDHTLQCLYGNVVHKCAALPPLDFGYFRDTSTKSKQLVVRNWNPEPKSVQLSINQTQALMAGYNVSLRVYRPGLEGEHEVRHSKSPLEFFLKSHQFLLLNIQVQPYQNATCSKLTLILATANEIIGAEMVARAENGTIALIPQVVRFTNRHSRQIQYINLVSTYSQQYNIREVSTNLTGLSVHYNQMPTIHSNEWVGMSVVYDPNADFNISQPWTTSNLQLPYLQHRRNHDYQFIKYARVHLTTNTGLEANSTVIVERTFPQFIHESEPSLQLEGIFQIKKLMLKRKKKILKKEERQSGEIRLTLSNPLDVPLQYSLHILSEPKIKDLQKTIKNYEIYTSQQLEDGFMCVSQELKNKWNINASIIKSIFHLGKLPQECSIEKSGLDIFVTNQQKQKVQVSSNITMLYLAKSLRNECKICYRFWHRYYIHRLIDTELVNKVLEEEGLYFLTDFLKAELSHLDDVQLFQLDYIDIHSRVKEDFTKFCETFPDVMFFRFCHYLNIRVTSLSDTTRSRLPNDKPVILLPSQTHSVTLAITYPPGRELSQFLLVMANNYSRYETYRIQVTLKEPALRVQPILSQFEAEMGLSDVIWIKRKPYELPVFLNRGDYREEQGLITGARTFEIVNHGEIEVQVTHIGIQEKEIACAFGDIWLKGLTCQESEIKGSDWTARAPRQFPVLNHSQQAQAFVIGAGSSRNITINFQFTLPKQQMLKTPYFPLYSQQLQFAIYIYDGKGYYFKLIASFRVGDRELRDSIEQLQTRGLRVPLVNYHTINLISLTVICVVLLRLQRDEGGVKKREGGELSQATLSIHKINRMKRLSKILSESSYSYTDSSIGLRLTKRTPERPVHTISEDLLISVRQAKHRELKKYFNQSQESEIGGMVGFNHHLSLSHSISYEQQEHDNNQQPGRLIELADPSKEEESEPHLQSHSQQQSHSSQSPKSLHSSHSAQLLAEEGSQSELPEGEVVNLDNEVDEDSSWYDFNQSNSLIGGKNVSQEMEEDQFYNVFRSEIRLKKEPDNNYARYHHHKRD